MLKSRIKQRDLQGTRAVARLTEIRSSIAALNDEDLLDLADIFQANKGSPLEAMTVAEMAKRNLSL